jgi:hypothetical protein
MITTDMIIRIMVTTSMITMSAMMTSTVITIMATSLSLADRKGAGDG